MSIVMPADVGKRGTVGALPIDIEFESEHACVVVAIFTPNMDINSDPKRL